MPLALLPSTPLRSDGAAQDGSHSRNPPFSTIVTWLRRLLRARSLLREQQAVPLIGLDRSDLIQQVHIADDDKRGDPAPDWFRLRTDVVEVLRGPGKTGPPGMRVSRQNRPNGTEILT